MRLVSAIVLAIVAVLATWGGALSFAGLVAAVAVALIWEWGRLTRQKDVDRADIASGLAVLVAIGLVAGGHAAAAVLLLAAGGCALAFLQRRDDGLVAAAGLLYAGLPSLALVWLRGAPEFGWQAVLLVLLIVWATDTGAFVAGRALGGPRLWASVSPNKTWAGLAGGVLSAAIVAWLYTRWLGSPAPGRIAALALVLGGLSQLGDLAESAMKRTYGVKDTSRLIPGHGGFMDRVDGLVFAAVAAAIYAALLGAASPGATLLGMR